MPSTRRMSTRSMSSSTKRQRTVDSKSSRKRTRRKTSSASSKRSRRSRNGGASEVSEREDSDRPDEVELDGPAQIDEEEDIAGQNLQNDFDSVSEALAEDAESEPLVAGMSGLRRRRRSSRNHVPESIAEEEEEELLPSTPEPLRTGSSEVGTGIRKMLPYLLMVLLLGALGWLVVTQGPRIESLQGVLNFRPMELGDVEGQIQNKMKLEMAKFKSRYEKSVKDLQNSIARVEKEIQANYERSITSDRQQLTKAALRSLEGKLLSSTKFKSDVEAAVKKLIIDHSKQVSSRIQGLKRETATVAASVSSVEKAASKIDAAVKARVKKLSAAMDKDIAALRKELEAKLISLQNGLSKPMPEGKIRQWTLEQVGGRVDDLIERRLELYSADRTGEIDYAIKAAGGMIIDSSPTQQNHLKRKNIFQYLRTPPAAHLQKRDLMLTPGTDLGQCWPMKGSEGFALIKLIRPIVPTHVSLEHVSKDITHNPGSALKNFEVFGANVKKPEQGDLVFLGRGQYKTSGRMLQQFPLSNGSKEFAYLYFKILSNHGGDHTCVYRIRVHGVTSASL